jgi:hypothetical protein
MAILWHKVHRHAHCSGRGVGVRAGDARGECAPAPPVCLLLDVSRRLGDARKPGLDAHWAQVTLTNLPTAEPPPTAQPLTAPAPVVACPPASLQSVEAFGVGRRVNVARELPDGVAVVGVSEPWGRWWYWSEVPSRGRAGRHLWEGPVRGTIGTRSSDLIRLGAQHPIHPTHPRVCGAMSASSAGWPA